MRLFEIAKKLGMPTKELMSTLRVLKIPASSHMSTLSEEQSQILFNHFKPASSTEPKKTVKAAEGKPQKGADQPVRTKPLSSEKMKEAVKSLKGVSTVATAPREALPQAMPPKKGFILVKKKKEAEAVIPASVPPLSSPSVVSSPVETPPVAVTPPAGSPPPMAPETDTVHSAHDLPPSPVVSPSTVVEPPASTMPSSPAPALYYQKEDAEGLRLASQAAPVPAKKPVVEAVKGISAEEAMKSELKKGFRSRFKEKERKGPISTLLNTASQAAEDAPVRGRKWQDFRPVHKRLEQKAQKSQNPAVVDITKPRRKVIKLYEGLTVKEFSALAGIKVSALISKFMGLGKMLTANQPIGLEEAMLISEELDVKAELTLEKTEEEILRPALPQEANQPDRKVPRPPVITIMGHVDHGKTSLLDAIRQTKVREGESGGITQHIGAYTVAVHGKAVTFLDTPGHEAFTAMRARGAKITDIVVLVVAADDGVMPQTIEAIHHAQAANVPIVVAVNKIDVPDANPERVKTALAEYNLVPEAWGGKTLFMEVSAKQKLGLEHFLEMILLQADVLELTGNPDTWMEGVVLEAKLSRGRGPVATVLVQQGTLRVGDAFVAGVQAGRVRALINDMGEQVKEASLSMAVEVIGFSGVPSAGDTFMITEDERAAKDVAQDRMHRQRISALAHMPRVTLQDLSERVRAGNAEELRLVIKADVQGSVGALADSIEKLSTKAVAVRVIHKGVGGITESDILLASASNAIVIGFHVRPDPSATIIAEREKIDLRLYDVIYDALEDVKKAMTGLLAPTYKEKVLGRAEVRETFQIPKAGTICGCYVSHGVISRSGARVHLLRDQVVIHDGKLASLRRFKDDVKEVATGFECGIGLERFNDVKVGDILEVYIQEEVASVL